MTAQPLPIDVVLEAPFSLGIAYQLAGQKQAEDMAALLEAALSSGIAAGWQRLQHEGGYARVGRAYHAAELMVWPTIHYRAGEHEDVLRPHAHLIVGSETSGGDPVHVPAVSRAASAAQTACTRAIAEHLADAGVPVCRSRYTPAGHELEAFARAAEQIPRQACPAPKTVASQIVPLDHSANVKHTA